MVLNFEFFNFVHTRLRYLDAATAAIATYKPDGRDATYVNGQVAAARTSFNQFIAKYNASNAANGALEVAAQKCHRHAVAAYGCMKSCYRDDVAVSASILRLPKQDYNAQTTCVRLAALIDIWGTLPDLPSTGEPFTVGGMTKTELQDECNALEAKLRAARVADAEANKDLKRFNKKNDEWDRFVTAALNQGRALYAPDTPERAVIDAIPVAPSTQPPEQAEIDLAENPDSGKVRLEFSAEHATSFKVFHKGPGDAAFTEVADVLLPGEYSAVGLTAGTHEYQIVGVNSRGEGPASEIASIDVAVAAAA